MEDNVDIVEQLVERFLGQAEIGQVAVSIDRSQCRSEERTQEARELARLATNQCKDALRLDRAVQESVQEHAPDEAVPSALRWAPPSLVLADLY